MHALFQKYDFTIRTLATEVTRLRDDAYDYSLSTRIGPLVKRINRFLDENATMIFWGGALLFFVTHPPIFSAGFGIGLMVASVVCLGTAGSLSDVDFTACTQLAKVIAFLVSTCLTPATCCFLSGINPGYHTYNIFEGYRYGPLCKGFSAIELEINKMCYELARWIPFLDIRKNPKLFYLEPLMEKTKFTHS